MFLETGTTKKTDKFFISGTDGLNKQGNKVFVVDTDGKYKILWSGLRDECDFTGISASYAHNTSGCDGKDGDIYFMYNNIIDKFNLTNNTWSTISHINTAVAGGGSYRVVNSWNMDSSKRLICFLNETNGMTVGFNIFDINMGDFTIPGGVVQGSTSSFLNQATYDADNKICYFALGYYFYKFTCSTGTISYIGGSISNNDMFLSFYNGNIIGCDVSVTNKTATMYYVNTASGALTQYAIINFSESAYASGVSNVPSLRMKQVEDSIFVYAPNDGLISINLDDNSYHDVICNNVSNIVSMASASPVYCEYNDSLIYLDYYTNSVVRMYKFG